MVGAVASIGGRLGAPLLFLAVALGVGVAPSSSRAADDTYFHRFETVTVKKSYGFSGILEVGKDVGPPWNPEVTPVSQITFNRREVHKLPVPGGGTDWNKSLGIRLEFPFTLEKPSALRLRLSIPDYRIGPNEHLIFPGEGIVFNVKGRGVDWSRSITCGAPFNEWEIHELPYMKPGDYVLSMSGLVGGFGDRSLAPWSFNGHYLAFDVEIGETNVPLPGALVLLGTALAGAGAVGRRRQRRASIGASPHSADPGQGKG